MGNWPAYSPDINPIEHLWHKLSSVVQELHPEVVQMVTVRAIFDSGVALYEAWDAIPQACIDNLIQGPLRREIFPFISICNIHCDKLIVQ